MSHYTFLENNIDAFFKEVFGKTLEEMFIGDIITAHGDKCYQYQDDWEDAGIPFNHGTMVYMLTYTDKFGDNKGYERCNWVLDNYPIYKNTLENLK